MKHLPKYSLPLTVFAAIIMTLAACNSGGIKVTKEDMSAAREAGRQRAMELTPATAADTMLTEIKLLDVRERENRLRSQGMNQLADTYIESFLATLDSVNPQLAEYLRRL